MKAALRAAGIFFQRHFDSHFLDASRRRAQSAESPVEVRDGSDEDGGIRWKTAAILFADIADYTRLTELDEEGTHRRLFACLADLRSRIEAHGGRVAHSAGDAILAEFANADDALHCAVRVQLATPRRNQGYDEARKIRFRIGVNFGEVIANDGDIYGRAVNLAARLEALACAGGICVSESVRDEVGDDPAFRLVEQGRQYVKNIRKPVRVFWIEIDADRVVDPDLAATVKVTAAIS